MITTIRSTGSVAKSAGQAKDAARAALWVEREPPLSCAQTIAPAWHASDTTSRSTGFGPIAPLVRDLASGPPLKTAAWTGGSAVVSDTGHPPDTNLILVECFC